MHNPYTNSVRSFDLYGHFPGFNVGVHFLWSGSRRLRLKREAKLRNHKQLYRPRLLSGLRPIHHLLFCAGAYRT